MGLIDMKKRFSILRDYLEDIFIGAGVVVINLATYQLDTIIGMYCTGLSLIAIGIILARQPPRR